MTGGDRAPAGRVLVVEDDVGTAEAIRAILEDEGYTVDMAANGREALARIALMRPDAILLDLMMPIMNGSETARALHADPATREIPLVVTTVSRQLIPQLDIAYTAMLEKPFVLETLLDTVASAVAAGRS